jgi:hypothetical protein
MSVVKASRGCCELPCFVGFLLLLSGCIWPCLCCFVLFIVVRISGAVVVYFALCVVCTSLWWDFVLGVWFYKDSFSSKKNNNNN